MSERAISLRDFHVSETHGFLLEDPLEKLPEYFVEWNDIGTRISELVEKKQLRAEINRMALLDHSRLHGYRQKRLAYMFLTFMANGYIWQEGESGVVRNLPRSVAVPLCALAEDLGLQPAVCHASNCLSNWQLKDRDGPLRIENMRAICFFPGGRHFEWLCIATAQIELDIAPGLQAICDTICGVSDRDEGKIVGCLKEATRSLVTVRKSLLRLYEELGPNEFYDLIQPWLIGWAGEDSPLQEGVVYEGVSETPKQVNRAIAGQSSSILSFDAFLGITHDKVNQEILSKILHYMPRDHANFVKAIRNGPSVRDYATSCDNTDVKDAYNACVNALAEFRSTHIQVVTRYIIGPSNREQRQRDYEGISMKGTAVNGRHALKFLKAVRGTTRDGLLQPDDGNAQTRFDECHLGN